MANPIIADSIATLSGIGAICQLLYSKIKGAKTPIIFYIAITICIVVIPLNIYINHEIEPSTHSIINRNSPVLNNPTFNKSPVQIGNHDTQNNYLH